MAQPRRKSLYSTTKVHGIRYRITTKAVPHEEFFFESHKASKIVVTLNSDHPFFYQFYSLFSSGGNIDAEFAKACVDLTILAAARAHWEWGGDTSKTVLDSFRRSWSNNLAAFLT
jgi:hypothetical protein